MVCLLSGETETSEGDETSQKVAPQDDCQNVVPQDDCQKVAPQDDSQPDDQDIARQDVSTEVVDVSSDSDCDVDISDGVS